MKDLSTTMGVDLCQADQALQHLLQTLLEEVPGHGGIASDITQITETVTQSEMPAVEMPLNMPSPAPLKDSLAATDPETRIRPGWADGELKALVIRVGKMRLAVPLVRLASIHPVASSDNPVRLPGQPAWHHGVTLVRGQQVTRVDVAVLLNLDSGQQDAAYLLLVDEGRFGLEVDAIEALLTLDADDIRWRQAGKGQAWILGILPEQMHILLDVDICVDMLGGSIAPK